MIENEANGIKQPSPWYKLAKCYDESDYAADKAIDCYWKAFRDGNIEALYSVGWRTLLNKVQSSNRTMSDLELINCIKKNALESKSSDLSFLMGKYYQQSKEWKNAEYWFLEASEKGSITAKCQLVLLYCNEFIQYNDAFSLAQKAYDAGSAEGARLLGMCYKLGIGTKKDKRKAKEILKIAADRGSEDAAKELKKIFF